MKLILNSRRTMSQSSWKPKTFNKTFSRIKADRLINICSGPCLQIPKSNSVLTVFNQDKTSLVHVGNKPFFQQKKYMRNILPLKSYLETNILRLDINIESKSLNKTYLKIIKIFNKLFF